MNQKRILRIEDLLELIPVSRATLDRWIREAREGLNDFPIPFSQPGRRMLWDNRVIEQWIAERHLASLPNVPPIKSERQRAKDYEERQRRAKQVLKRHGIKKGGQK